MKKRKTGKQRAMEMYPFGGEVGGNPIIKPLDLNSIRFANTPRDRMYRGSYQPYLGDMAPVEGETGYSKHQKKLLDLYRTYPEATAKGLETTYGKYNSKGVAGMENPTQLEQILNNVEYFKTNSPESNVYRDENQHHSINTSVKKEPIIAANGGVVDWAGLAGQVPGMANTVMDLFENRGSYSRQPIVNASTMRGMSTPYKFAFGGEVDEEEQMAELQAMADEQGISIEELIAQLQEEKELQEQQEVAYDVMEEDEEEEDEDYMEEVDPDVEEDDDDAGETFAFGGTANKIPVEIEGGEVMETPQGQIIKAKDSAPSHAEGGIKTSVPKGTKIYSDRIKVDGKTMQERKLSREKALNRLTKLAEKNPNDKLLQGSSQRTSEIHQLEEAQDMQLQEAMNMVQKAQKKYAGGTGPYGVGDPPSELAFQQWYNDRNKGGGKRLKEDGIMGPQTIKAYNAGYWNEYMQEAESSRKPGQYAFGAEYRRGASPIDGAFYNSKDAILFNNDEKVPLPSYFKNDEAKTNLMSGMQANANASVKKLGLKPTQLPSGNFNQALVDPNLTDIAAPDDSGFTTGDYVGAAGSLFNAIAPMINSRNAAKQTRPTINRFRGFGREAIAANDSAQGMANTMRSNTLTDIDTASNSAKGRNRSSARGVNTLRALDAITDMGTNKAKVGANDAFTRQLIGLIGQRGQLTNAKDTMEMRGQQAADADNDAKTDNYFSNNAQNLVNLGSNVVGLGRNLNTSRQNKVDSNLVASMSKNPIRISNQGNVVNSNLSPQAVQNYLDMGYTIIDGKLVRPRKRK